MFPSIYEHTVAEIADVRTIEDSAVTSSLACPFGLEFEVRNKVDGTTPDLEVF